jgi:photolyase PhrII
MKLTRHLEERTRRRDGNEPRSDRQLVLYWTRTSVRGHENPALDVAAEVANEQGLPLLVYHALDERYPWASDRHHRFIMEGALDLREELRDRGIPYLFHLARPGFREPWLIQLAERASLVVTEETPVFFLEEWNSHLQFEVDTPLWTVDCDCIVPMNIVGKAYDRAYKFRNATANERSERVGLEWPRVVYDGPSELQTLAVHEELGLRDLVFKEHDIAELIAECEIDHGVAPVFETPGGSKAGYERWNAFRENGLTDYAKKRNNPLIDGVSRMSPYFHYGHVSPFRIAREAHAIGDRGPDKYLDEFLVWREMAFSFCLFRDDPDSVTAIPDWARETLAEHESDERDNIYDWETLSRGVTGDGFWDAMQRSLVKHGELHNNLRMTWAKALIPWTETAAEALELAIDLNHRFALDGRDPASYGGILWCFGQFDRPFEPGCDIFGKVRYRSTDYHEDRHGSDRLMELVGRTRNRTEIVGRHSLDQPKSSKRVAVVGAGLAGSICARTLWDHGIDVTIFDKGRRPGGRVSTRNLGGDRVDYGAQYFTARDERFSQFVRAWENRGLVEQWAVDIGVRDADDGEWSMEQPQETRFVAPHGMASLVAHLQEELTVRFSNHVADVTRADDEQLLVRLESGEESRFDQIVVAIPPVQARGLSAVDQLFGDALQEVELAPCWTLMVQYEDPIEPPFLAGFLNDDALAFFAAQPKSEGGDAARTWTIHSTPEWARKHLEDDAEGVAEELRQRFEELADLDVAVATTACRAHRWRYALATEPLGKDTLSQHGVTLAGDWCLAARVEAAFLSGRAAAGRILASL